MNSDHAVALGRKPEDGSQRGREAEADPKLPGVALKRRTEADKDGTHVGESEAGSKQPPAVEVRCSGLVCLLAQGDLTLTFVTCVPVPDRDQRHSQCIPF